MNLSILTTMFLLLLVGCGYYFGGPAIGGSGIALILLTCLIVYLMGGFRAKT
jgi:hypothetical protein